MSFPNASQLNHNSHNNILPNISYDTIFLYVLI